MINSEFNLGRGRARIGAENGLKIRVVSVYPRPIFS